MSKATAWTGSRKAARRAADPRHARGQLRLGCGIAAFRQQLVGNAARPEPGHHVPRRSELRRRDSVDAADRSDGELFTQEIRVQSRGEGPFQWLAGVYYLKQDAYFSQFVADYSCPTCIPTVRPGFRAGRALRSSPKRSNDRSSQVSYDLTEQWTVGVGARYLEDELTELRLASDGFLLGGATEAGPSQRTTVHEFNPSAYVRFEPTEELTMYAQAVRGFRSGSVNQPRPRLCGGIRTARHRHVHRSGHAMELRAGPEVTTGRWPGEFERRGLSAEMGRRAARGAGWMRFTNGVNGGDVTSDGVELEMLPADTMPGSSICRCR